MPLIIEDEGKLLGKKQAKVPDKLVNKIKKNLNLFDQYKKSKGYKRASSIVDDDYNKRSKKKDKIHNGDKTLSFSDIKKIDHEYKDMSINDDDANENNLGFILPGGNDMKNWAHDTLRKMRTAVKKVDAVPPVPKLEKYPTKVKDVNKDIKMGNATVRITEEQLLILKEYHDQQVFNFNDKGEVYFQKNNWEHYVDYLEEIGTYGMLPASKWDKSTVSKVIERAKEKVEPGIGGTDDIDEYDYEIAFYDVLCQAYVYDNTVDELFEEEFIKMLEGYEEYKLSNNYYDECETLKMYLREKGFERYNSDELESFLTDLGQEEYQKTIKENFADNILEYDMEGSLTYNDRGLIYMERNIQIPNFNSPEFSENYYDREDDKDYYTYLVNVYGQGKFGGIGNCFSWEDGGGEAYCACGFGADSTEIKLKCWIDPKDINWDETVYRNCYSLKDEKEIYVNSDNAKIEVFDVVVESGSINGKSMSGKSLLKKPIIVRP